MEQTADVEYRLYWYPGTCSRVVYVALEEIGLPYETVLVDKPSGPHEEYLAINPKDKVPALQAGSRVITELPAIETFLARRHLAAGLLPVDGDHGIEALEVVSWFEGGIHRHVTPLRFPRSFCAMEEAWPAVRATARLELEKAFEIIESWLQTRDWVLGDQWSIADAHLLWLWFRATGSGMDGSRFSACAAHAGRCEQRSSVAFVLDREEAEFARLQAAGLTPPHVPDFQVGRSPSYA